MESPIDADAETTAVFIGRSLRGPVNVPVLLSSFAEFRRRFGGHWTHSSLAPAVEQFFSHGGRRLYVVRVVNNARGAMLCLPAAHGMLVLRAVEPGSTECIRAAVDYDGVDDGDSERFNLTLQRVAPASGLVVDQEIHRDLGWRKSDRRYVADVLWASELARVQEPVPAGRPLPTAVPGHRQSPGYVAPVQAGSDGAPLTDYDLVGCTARRSGLFALDAIEDPGLLYLPPAAPQVPVGPTALLAAEQYCRRRGAMLIMDPAPGWDSAAAAIESLRRDGYASPNMLTYFPPLTSRAEGDRRRAAGGALAGLLCRLDRRHGPWQALHRTNLAFDRKLRPALDVGPDDARRLLAAGINVVARNAVGQAAVYGSMTLARSSHVDRRYASLTVRRLCLAIGSAVARGTRWAVVGPRDSAAAGRVRAQVHAYLVALADRGALASDEFSVHCEAVSQHELLVELSFQPTGANSPVSLTLHQGPRGCRVMPAAYSAAVAA